MRQLLLLLIGLCWTAVGFSQRNITGTVIDPAGDAVIGATVLVTGTTTGTITDLDGNFTITVPEGNPSLTFSYIGYEPQTVELPEGSDVVDLTLSEGVALDEVVVTGYSTGTKRDATAAIATISADKLTAIPSGNVEQQLQGRASGVTVITNGQPGTQSKVRIRGFGSFGANNPLYVVDGVPTNSIAFLPPEDIETTSILKDASSASIYGARAANGVVVYTTKQGNRSTDGIRVSYDGLIGVTTPGTGQDILNPTQQADWTLRALKNGTINNGELVDTTEYTHPQYGSVLGSDGSWGLPDYLLVGTAPGVSAEDVNLAEEAEKYNDDYGAGDIYLVTPTNKEGTDWYGAATNNAILTRHNLGISGGGESNRFYVGFSAQDQDGILLEQNFKRYAFRANSEFDVAPRVRVGQNLQFTYNSTLGLIGTGAGEGGGQAVASQESDILTAFRLAPAIPVRNQFGGYGGTGVSGFNNPRNVVAQREARSNDKNNNISLFGNIFAEVDIIDGLYLRSTLGGNYASYNGRFFNRRTYEDSENTASFGYGEYQGTSYDYISTTTLNFNFDISEDHKISGLVGFEAVSSENGTNSSASGINPFNNNPDFVSINQVQNPFAFSSYSTPKRLVSQIGQIAYNYQSKYYVTGVLRRDQGSVLAETVRADIFPGISAAWRITGEDFLQPTNFLSDLKLRAGYGTMGNIAAVPGQNRFNAYGSDLEFTSYDINGTGTSAAQGFRQVQLSNPGATWEISTTTNIGLEASFLNASLDVTIDAWQKKNTDVLIRQPLPSVLGLAAPPVVNAAEIDNKGIDLELTYRGSIAGGDFSYETTLTGSFLKNEILTIAETVPFFESGATRAGQPVRNLAGQPLSTFFGYTVDGIFNSQAEVDAAPEQLEAAPGRFKYKDINGFNENNELTGIPDGIINAADRGVIGNPIPNFTGGLNLILRYKGFDVETYLYSSLGNEIFNFSKWFTDFYASFPGAAISTRVLESWTPENQSQTQPIFENAATFSSNNTLSSFYVEDGSYLRMRHITLGYSLPTASFNGIFTRARVYASANNIFTITGYKGLDPQVGGAADTDFGIDLGNYPVTRSFNFGIGLGF